MNKSFHLGEQFSVIKFHERLVSEIYTQTLQINERSEKFFIKDDMYINNKFTKMSSEPLDITEIHLKTKAFQLCTSLGRLQ